MSEPEGRGGADVVLFTEFGSGTAAACGSPLQESHEWALRVAIPAFASVVTLAEVA